MPTPIRLIAYVRVSSNEQAVSGLGLSAQKRKVMDAIEREGHTLVEVIADAGEHGTTLQRPGLRRALEMIAAGEADGLIGAKLDRVSRSVIDFATLLAWFTEAKASLVVLDPALDTTTPSGRLIANVFASVAEWEADTIAQRTKDALGAKRAAGERVGRTAVLERPEVVARILDLRDQGLTIRAIAATLDAEGVPTARGAAHWSVGAIQSTLGYQRPKARRRVDLPNPRPRRKVKASAAR